jgi:predicted metal-binding membrane protein
MVRRVDDRRPFLAVLTALIALAWLALWLWGRSPAGQFLSHDAGQTSRDAQVSTHEHVVAADGAPGDHAAHQHATEHRGPTLLLTVAGWTLMTSAMMLPSTLPLLALFHGVTRRRPDRSLLIALLIAGYLGVWALFGFFVHSGDLQLHAIMARTDWLADHAWLIAAMVVLVAGVYQFTPLKHRCLDRCRSPLGFIQAHWRGRQERLEALRLGVHHGLFCVGCCWSLMLLMFAVGVGNLGWMLLLGAVMAAEKNLPWGRRLSAPVGLALLAWGVLLVAGGVTV